MSVVALSSVPATMPKVLSDPKESRPLLQKTIDWFTSWRRMIGYSCQHASHSRIYTSKEWKEKSEGLVVLVHGLGEGGPVSWTMHVSILEQHPTIDIFTPKVVKDGRCALEEAAEPIFQQVSDYIKNHPTKPVCLIGGSNGSRIVTWIETKLRNDHPNTAVRVSTIAGIHLGTWGVNLLAFLRVPQCLQRIGWGRKFPPVLCDELRVGSEKAKRLLESVKAPLPENCAPRSYELIAAAHDWMVFNTESSLPELNMGEARHIVYGHGHLSVLSAVAREQIDGCLAWMRKGT